MHYVFQFGVIADHLPALLYGTWRTIVLSGQAMALGLAIGVTGAAIRTSRQSALRPARGLTSAFVELVRNTPLLAQLFLLFFGLPRFGIRLSPDTVAVVGLGLNCGAYAIEIIRAGIQSVPMTQIEAGLSLGLRPRQVFRFVILFPALKAVFPALSSQFIVVLLSSSIVSSISATELTAESAVVQMETFRAFEVYFVVSLIYLALSVAFRAGLNAVYARWLGRSDMPALVQRGRIRRRAWSVATGPAR